MVKVVVVGMVLVTEVVAVKVEEVVGNTVLVTDVVAVKVVVGNMVLVKVALTRTWCRWWWWW